MNGMPQIASQLREVLRRAGSDELDAWIASLPDWALVTAAVLAGLLGLAILGWGLHGAYGAMTRPSLVRASRRRAPKRPKAQSEPQPGHEHWTGLTREMQAKLEQMTAAPTSLKPPTPAQLKQLKDDEEPLVAAAAEEGAPADVFRELGAMRSLLDPPGAIEAFEVARALDPTDFWTRAFLARLYERSSRPDEAKEEAAAAVHAAAAAWQLMDFEDQVLSADETLELLEAARRALPNVPETLEAQVKAASGESAREFAQLLGLLISLGARFVDRDLRTGASALEWSACIAAGLTEGQSPEAAAQLANDRYVRERLAHLNSFEALQPQIAALLARLEPPPVDGSGETSPPAPDPELKPGSIAS